MELYDEVPAMAQGEYHATDGTFPNVDALEPRAQELLADYRLVQYDLAAGHRYAEKQLYATSSRTNAGSAALEQRGKRR
jgi:hypothetical protein